MPAKTCRTIAALVAFAAPGQRQAIAQTAAASAHAPDGGVRKTLQSILVPPLTNAPFSATVQTEWTTILPDGTMATVWNHRTIARDTSGRVFEERRFFMPDGDTQITELSALEYSDPNRHEFLSCIPARRTCYASTYNRPTLSVMPPNIGGLEACACATLKRPGMTVEQEAIGEKTIEQVQTIGSREITTIAQGQIGNRKPEPIVKEFWYSPRLGINLVTKRFDPRSGIANFFVTRVSLNEPAQSMFEPPADYQIVREVVERPGLPGSGK